jgi:hypothetical protein
MSGGFSENGYLFEKVRLWAGKKNIAVSRGDDW